MSKASFELEGNFLWLFQDNTKVMAWDRMDVRKSAHKSILES